jgi:hypothetical protein
METQATSIVAYQAAFGFWRPRAPKPPPPKRPARRYKLLDAGRREGRRVTFRVSLREAKQLVEAAKILAKREGGPVCVSAVIRDALYEVYEIGELAESAGMESL